MILVLRPDIAKKDFQHIIKKIRLMGLKPHISKGIERTIVGLIGDERKIQLEQLKALAGVEKVMPVLKPYKLVSREFKKNNSVIRINNDVEVGSRKIVVMAGPCAVESRKQIIDTAIKVKEAGAVVLRAGAFKPRTSPYSFQGLGEKGLKYLADARERTGLAVVTEVMDTKDVSLVARYADIIQVGARNMQNFNLLKAVGKQKKPVLLKRGMSATLIEFLMSAEYILSEGNPNVILCERGIRTFVEYSRNTLDLNIVPKIKKLSHLPIIVDPSHGTGEAEMVAVMSKGALAVGADGLMIEVHPKPEDAVSDGDQSLTPEQFQCLMTEIMPIVRAESREL